MVIPFIWKSVIIYTSLNSIINIQFSISNFQNFDKYVILQMLQILLFLLKFIIDYSIFDISIVLSFADLKG